MTRKLAARPPIGTVGVRRDNRLGDCGRRARRIEASCPTGPPTSATPEAFAQ